MRQNFRADFRQLVATRGDDVAIVDAKSGIEWSWSELDEYTNYLVNFLADLNVGSEKMVVSMLPNSVDAILVLLGCMKCGVDLAPLPHQASVRETREWVKLTKPCLILVPDIISNNLYDALVATGTEVLRLDLSKPLGWLSNSDQVLLSQPSRSSHLCLKTSGTTGEPKAMVFDTERLWASGHSFISQHSFVDRNSRFLNNLPVSYLGGLFNLGLIPLASGGSVVIAEPFSGRSFLNFWQDVERFEINVLWVVPSIVRGLIAIAQRTGRHKLKNRLHEVRAAFLGTAPIELETKIKFEELFGISLLENFALSETTFFSSETLGSRFQRVQGSVGEPLPYVDLRFGYKPDEDDIAAEIEVKTPYAFIGYLDVDGSVELPLTADGFFKTGDLGHLNEQGNLVIDGRLRDIIKKGGHFVALREIETLAVKHDSVSEAAAVSVPHEFYGEDFILAVKLNSETGEQGVSEFTRWLHDNLVAYKWPQRVLVLDDFPRTESGKVVKSKILSNYK
ncbi:MAG: class I adenylate-forming enzyme family protein [Burkholderiales bacterium]|nr:class I adenylate-forming enzyme family protein [Burkholderiales bacterium]